MLGIHVIADTVDLLVQMGHIGILSRHIEAVLQKHLPVLLDGILRGEAAALEICREAVVAYLILLDMQI